MMKRWLIGIGTGVVLALAAGAPVAFAQENPCGLCDTEVVMNAPLAQCFLDQYSALEQREAAAVIVDLSSCAPSLAKDRGVVEALPSAQAATAVEPTMEFMLSRAQLGCLKEKLQQPGLVLDPSATIKLDACNDQSSGAQ